MTSRILEVPQRRLSDSATTAASGERDQQAAAQGEFTAEIDSSPRVAAQRLANVRIQQSPVATAQRRGIETIANGAGRPTQRVVKEIPGSPDPIAQRRTLAQAGLDGGMAETAGQALIGGNVGPLLGSSYVAAIGVQASKTAALGAAAASYGGFVQNIPVDGLLSVNTVFAEINAAKQGISDYIAGLAGDEARDTSTVQATDHIKTQLIEPAVNPAVKTDVSAAELTDIYAALRNPVTKNGSNRFFANPRADGVLNTYIRAQINAGWRANANVPLVDPFLYRPLATVAGNPFSVSYQHSPDWPGYVTYITDGASTASMRVAGAIAHAGTAGIPAEFGRKHHETDHSVLANDLTLNALDTRVTNERRLDSMTKLAGEGARFLCVRNNLARMTDKSRFYVVGAEESRYVTLEDLWSSWATAFGKANNIANATVRAEILNGNNWTYDQGGGRESRIFNIMDELVWGNNDVNLT